MQLEEFLQIIVDNWQTILEYAIMILLYFFVGISTSKTKNTKTLLTTLFKENKTEMANSEAKVHQELEQAKEMYDRAVRQISTLEKELLMCKQALRTLVSEEEVENERVETES